MRLWIAFTSAFALLLGAGQASALTIGFDCLTGNLAGD